MQTRRNHVTFRCAIGGLHCVSLMRSAFRSHEHGRRQLKRSQLSRISDMKLFRARIDALSLSDDVWGTSVSRGCAGASPTVSLRKSPTLLPSESGSGSIPGRYFLALIRDTKQSQCLPVSSLSS